NSNIFPDQTECQLLHSNIQHMILDVQTIRSQRLEQSHHGHPDVLSWEHTGSVGRPRAVIDPNFLQWAHHHRSTTGIADFLGLSRRTVRRALLEQGIVSPGGVPFEDQNAASSIQSSLLSNRRSNMSNDTLDSFIRLIRWGIVIHGFIDGYSRMITALRAADNNRSSTVLSLFLSA
ncbi:hypothetical protein FB446DRAFT_623393, partial [Lentinula raphanica]